MPKNKERTWIELLKACMDYKSNGFNEVLWAYVTALRGPDIIIAFAETDRHLKAVFTCPLRGTYVNMDVRDYLKLLPIHIENAFKKLNDEKKIYTYTHYLDHIKMVWQYSILRSRRF